MGLPVGTYGPASISFIDAGGERCSWATFGKVITEANHDAQDALFDDVIAAVDAVVLASRVQQSYADTQIVAGVRPTNGAARELALRIKYRDATTAQMWTERLPGIDKDAFVYDQNLDAKDAVLMTTPSEVVDLIDALEAFVVNPEAPTHVVNVVALKIIRGQK